MTTQPLTIVGAGLAGLLAAAAWPNATLVERSAAPTQAHRALLRFRSEAVAQLTGIEFRRVQVRKGIWDGAGFIAPTIRAANQYSQKCIDRLGAERSIWNVAPVERFIAPDDLHEQLLDSVRGRVVYGVDAFAPNAPFAGPFVSTAPLSATSAALDITPPGMEFGRAPIFVQRVDLGPRCDVFQTIYFPDPDLSLYRASITGRTLIMEFASEREPFDKAACTLEVIHAFGLSGGTDWVPMGGVKQQYGKIAPIEDDAARKALLFRLTHQFGIYSLGRFATWRNILLDDVVQDIAVVKRLMRAGVYDLRAAAA